MKLLLLTFILIARSSFLEIPPDKGPFFEGCPEQEIAGFEDDDFYDVPKGNWFCFAPECPGHQYANGEVGCKTNILREIFNVLNRKR